MLSLAIGTYAHLQISLAYLSPVDLVSNPIPTNYNSNSEALG